MRFNIICAKPEIESETDRDRDGFCESATMPGQTKQLYRQIPHTADFNKNASTEFLMTCGTSQ